MEGISIGEEDGRWYIGISLDVRSHDDVTGYPSLTAYYQDFDMRLLTEETLLGPKCLIKW